MLVNLFIVIAENSDLERAYCDIIRTAYALATCMTFDQLKNLSGNDHKNIPSILRNHFGSSDSELKTRLSFLVFPPTSDSEEHDSWQKKMNDSKDFLNNCYHSLDIQVSVWFVGYAFVPDFLSSVSRSYDDLQSLKNGLMRYIRLLHNGRSESKNTRIPHSLLDNSDKTIYEVVINESLQELPNENSTPDELMEVYDPKSDVLTAETQLKGSGVDSALQVVDSARELNRSDQRIRRIDSHQPPDTPIQKTTENRIRANKKTIHVTAIIKRKEVLQMPKPKKKIIILCSSEADDYVKDLQLNLLLAINNRSLDYQVETWRNPTVMGNGRDTINALFEYANNDLKRNDGYAVCFFTPDDEANIRGDDVFVSRDNVWLEYGLFTGILNPTHVFAVFPKETVSKNGKELKWHKPSDYVIQHQEYPYAENASDIKLHIELIANKIVDVIVSQLNKKENTYKSPSVDSNEHFGFNPKGN